MRLLPWILFVVALSIGLPATAQDCNPNPIGQVTPQPDPTQGGSPADPAMGGPVGSGSSPEAIWIEGMLGDPMPPRGVDGPGRCLPGWWGDLPGADLPIVGAQGDLPAAPPLPSFDPTPPVPPNNSQAAPPGGGGAAGGAVAVVPLTQQIRLGIMGLAAGWAGAEVYFRGAGFSWWNSKSEDDSCLEGLTKGAAAVGCQFVANWCDMESSYLTFVRAVYDRVVQ